MDLNNLDIFRNRKLANVSKILGIEKIRKIEKFQRFRKNFRT